MELGLELKRFVIVEDFRLLLNRLVPIVEVIGWITDPNLLNKLFFVSFLSRSSIVGNFTGLAALFKKGLLSLGIY
jgi:hypothetical protein